MRRALLRAGVAIGAVGAAGLAWGLVEAHAFTLRRVDLEVLPPGGRDLRVLHVSDLHLRPGQDDKLAFVASLADLAPDLVVTTGDNFTHPDALDPLMAAWGPLLATPGVFVFGSNDYHAPVFKNPLAYLIHGRSEATTKPQPDLPWQELRDRMAAGGWQDLTHRRTTLEVGGYRLSFRGTDDAHLDRDDYSLVEGPADVTADLNVGVTHAPYLRLLDGFTADGMDLIFAGHTHGGQVCVPGYGALVTNCDLDAARVKGLSTHTAGGQTAHLQVSAGLGTSPFAPYRFACRPEATLLTLRPRSAV